MNSYLSRVSQVDSHINQGLLSKCDATKGYLVILAVGSKMCASN
jgi:hypothetical protein